MKINASTAYVPVWYKYTPAYVPVILVPVLYKYTQVQPLFQCGTTTKEPSNRNKKRYLKSKIDKKNK
jgi:hypothetical protein